MQSCAPHDCARFRPRAPLHPLLLLVHVRAGLKEELTQEGVPEVRKEFIPPIRPPFEFEFLKLSARADVPDVGSFHLGHEARLHQVKLRVKHAFPEPEAREREGDDLGDRHPRSLLERDLYGCAEDERQAARLDKAHTAVFTLVRWLVHTVLKVPRDTGGQAGELTLELQLRGTHEGGIHGEMDRLDFHNCREPVGWDLPPDGKELAGPVLVGAHIH